MMKRILIIAAHPDDEILGCGGLIQKYTQVGASFKILFLGEGSTCRYKDPSSKEALKAIEERNSWAISALNILGISDSDFHNLPCGRFDQVPVIEINKIIENTIKEYQPDTIFTHSSLDPNSDHQITYKSTIMSTRPCGGHIVKKLFSYEVLSSSEWSFKEAFKPNYFIGLSNEQVQKKWQALECYKSEMRDYPFPRSWEGVHNLAINRGIQSGNEYAEAFHLIREFD